MLYFQSCFPAARFVARLLNIVNSGKFLGFLVQVNREKMSMRSDKMGIAGKLTIAFGLLVAVTIALAAFAIGRVHDIGEALSSAEHLRSQQLDPLYEVREALDQTGIAARNAYIFKDDGAAQRELDLVDRHVQTYRAALQGLDLVLRDNPDYRKVREELDAMATELRRPRAYRQAGDLEGYGTFLVDECTPLRRRIVGDIDVLLKSLQADSAQASAAAEATATSAGYTIGVLAALCALLATGVGVGIVRHLQGQLGGEPVYAAGVARAIAQGELQHPVDVRRAAPSSLLAAMSGMRDSLSAIVGKVRSGTDAIAAASAEIASGNIDLSQRTENQAAELARVAGSMKQMLASVRGNAEHAVQASRLAEDAAAVSRQGGATVDEVVATMHTINQASSRIVDIISVIDGIAFQTNILALNAAVEAARAGEQGRGFAVVASEVRSLAHRSAAAAKEIKVLIEDSVGKVGAGTELVGEAGATMRTVVERIGRVTAIMNEISQATRAQCEDIERVDDAIVTLDEMTLKNAALVEEAAAAAQSLRQQADGLAGLVNVFQLEDAPAPAGQRRAAPSPRPALARAV